MQRPVAEVTIFEGLAILVTLAVARDHHSHAGPTVTLVSHGARIPIIASYSVLLELAAAKTVTRIVSARIGIIAEHRIADTISQLTVISHRACVAVFAFAAIKDLIPTARFTIARIDGTFVAVVTEVHIVTTDFVGLIDVTIAVVVHPVADLGCRLCRIASPQPLLEADALASTGSPLVGNLAGSPERTRNGLVGAGAFARIGHTLQRAQAVNCLRLLAGETPGAILISLAVPAAETKSPTVGNASINLPPRGSAIRTGRARLAEIREI